MIKKAIFTFSILLNLLCAGHYCSIHKSENDLEIVEWGPQNSVDESQRQPIFARFNRKITPEELLKSSFDIYPPLAGKCELMGKDTLVFTPEKELDPAHEYRVHLEPKSLQPRRGRFFGHEWRFTTSRLKLVEAKPFELRSGSRYRMKLVFNHPVNPSVLKGHLHLRLTENRKAVPYRLETRLADREIVVTFAHEGEPTIDVEVSADMPSLVGHLKAGEPSKRRVAFKRHLQIYSLAVEQRRGDFSLRCRMNACPNSMSLAKHIEVKPELPMKFIPWWGGFKILGDFESGKRYFFTFNAGMPAGGTSLKETWHKFVDIPDRRPHLKFRVSQAYLPPQPSLILPLQVTNLSRVELRMRPLLMHNLIEMALESETHLPEELAGQEQKWSMNSSSAKNMRQELYVDLASRLGEKKLGVYYLEAYPRGKRWKGDRTLVAVSDLGLHAQKSKNKLHLWVRSLGRGRALANVELRLYSHKREALAEALSDERGWGSFSLKSKNASGRPALVVAKLGEDVTWMRFRGNEIALPKAAYRGDAYLDKGYEAHISTDKPILRPGARVRLFALLRDRHGKAPERVPLELSVFKPGGKKLMRRNLQCDEHGAVNDEFAIPRESPTGNYRITLSLPGQSRKVMGSRVLRVVDYVPPSLEVSLSGNARRFFPGEDIDIAVSAKHSFGLAAKALTSRARVQWTACPFVPRADYHFGDERIVTHARVDSLGQLRLNTQGKCVYTLRSSQSAAAALLATVEVDVFDKGGRSVSRRIEASYYPSRHYLGYRLVLEEGSRFAQLVVVDTNGATLTRDVKLQAKLYRVNQEWLLKRNAWGGLSYQRERIETPLFERSIVLEGGELKLPLPELVSGTHRLVVDSEASDIHPLSREFRIDEGGSERLSKTPRKLLLELPETLSRSGDRVEVKVTSPFRGQALITVKSDVLLHQQWSDILPGNNTIELGTREDWPTNVWVSVQAFRPVVLSDKWLPFKQEASACLSFDRSDKRLKVEIETPQKWASGKRSWVKVHVSHRGAIKSEIPVHLFLVDDSVYKLADAAHPDPWRHFNRKRRLDWSHLDLYRKLLPQLSHWKVGEDEEPGGGGRSFASRLNPVQAQRFRILSRSYAKLKTSPKGFVNLPIELPDWTGKLSLIAIAYERDSYGSAQSLIRVSSEIQGKIAFPRFVAPGDRFVNDLGLFNRSQKREYVKLRIETQGPLSLEGYPNEIPVDAGGETRLPLRWTATGVGKASVTLWAHLGEHRWKKKIELPLRPATAFVRNEKFVTLTPGKTWKYSALDGYMLGTRRVQLNVGGAPWLPLRRYADRLSRYPYGCLEQTSSKLLPLVYLPDLVPQKDRHNNRALVAAGIQRLSSMQTHTGGLAMWPGGRNASDFGSLYAAHLLIECRGAGHDVSKALLEPLCTFLESRLRQWVASSRQERGLKGFENIAYAMYVLNRVGRAKVRHLHTLDELYEMGRKSGKGITPSARAFTAHLHWYLGDREKAKRILLEHKSTAKAGHAFDSSLREQSVLLNVLVDLMPESDRVDPWMESLSLSLLDNEYLNTQECGWAILAMGKRVRQLVPAKGEVRLQIADRKAIVFDAERGGQWSLERLSKALEVQHLGQGKLHVNLIDEGLPKSGHALEMDRNISIRRRFFDIDGNREIKSGHFEQSKLYRVHLEIKASKRHTHLVISELLSAGMELEIMSLNSASRLLSTSATEGLEVEHVEQRDDRLLAFVAMRKKVARYSYVLRAVSRGKFALPASDIAHMYNHRVVSVHGAGRIEVVSPVAP